MQGSMRQSGGSEGFLELMKSTNWLQSEKQAVSPRFSLLRIVVANAKAAASALIIE
jgi:hypothetical protein